VSSNNRAVRRLDPTDLATRLPYPVARVSLTLLAPANGGAGTSGDAYGGSGGAGADRSAGPGAGGSPERTARPARMNLPRLDEGPHLGYAIQWFSFAAIAVIGVTLLLRQERRSPTARQV
jgi:cytochrome oxidase assembly protein ShyY1